MRAKSRKKITIDKYMNKALYDNASGYYVKKNPFGKNGDYITAPNISILFSEMIAIWIILFWKELNCPKNFNLIELGAGNGEMIFEIIRTFNKFPLLKKSCNINILEKSKYLRIIQKKKLKKLNVKWLNNLREVSNYPSIFIANEFFDALPVKQFIKKNNLWYERNIKISEKYNPEIVDILTNIKKVEKKIGFNISYKQNFIEYSPLSKEYLKIIAKKINKNNGGILIIDYGYWEHKMKNTLKGAYKHNFNNYLKNIGKSDITYNLSFHLLEKIIKKLNLRINEKINQRDFLVNLGIIKRAEIISKNVSFKKKADIFYRIERLINKNSMGELFKVMVATKKDQI